MQRRPSYLKIPDIKHVRSITRFLGKLSIEGLYRVDPWRTWGSTEEKIMYGWTLSDAKSYVESKYTYYDHSLETNLDKVREHNIIHEIKRTRQFMHMLNKLGLSSPDAGLAICKAFVTRRRN